MGLSVEQIKDHFAKQGLDLTPLKLRIVPSSGSIDTRFESTYDIPLLHTDEADPQIKAETMVKQSVVMWIYARQVQRDKEAYNREQLERSSQCRYYLSRVGGEK